MSTKLKGGGMEEGRRLYEAMFVIDINRTSTDERAIKRVIHPLVKKHNGEILVSKRWAEYVFAYPIKRMRRGVYHLMYLLLEPSKVGELKRDCYLKEEILRVLFLRVKTVPEKVALPDGGFMELKEQDQQEQNAETIDYME